MPQQHLQTDGFQDPASTAMFADSVSLITGEEWELSYNTTKKKRTVISCYKLHIACMGPENVHNHPTDSHKAA